MVRYRMALVICAAMVLVRPALAAGGSYDVRAFGARGDGVAKDTRAVEAAISAAAAGGGGEVDFPAGRYVCGTIHLRSDVSLHLMAGAAIVESRDEGDFDAREALPFKPADDGETTYFHHALLLGDCAENIAIYGPGTIDGNHTKRGGPKPISLKACTRVTIRDVTIIDSPSYALSMLGCSDVVIDGVRVVNSWADGIDPDCCRNVRIANCSVDSTDDAICLKSSGALGKPVFTEHVTVTNCVLASDCNCFKTGTESRGGFRYITVSNCTMNRRAAEPDGSGIALETVDGAVLDQVAISNITMRDLLSPIFIRLGNRGRGMATKVPGSLRNITISDVVSTGSTIPSMILGIPGHPVRGVSLSGIRITMAGGVKLEPRVAVPEDIGGYPDADRFGVLPAFGLYVRHADGLVLDGVDVRSAKPDARAAAILDDVHNVRIAGFQTEGLAAKRPALWLNECASALITGCAGSGPSSPFARVSGRNSRAIKLLANELAGYARAVETATGVPRNAVALVGNTSAGRR